jgi:hypothetical protein
MILRPGEPFGRRSAGDEQQDAAIAVQSPAALEARALASRAAEVHGRAVEEEDLSLAARV